MQVAQAAVQAVWGKYKDEEASSQNIRLNLTFQRLLVTLGI